MRIEINAGGLKGLVSVNEFTKSYEQLVDRHRDVVSAFKEVKSNVNNMSGGTGNLQTAVDCIENRIVKTDEQKLQNMEGAAGSFAVFLTNAVRTDKQVAAKVALSNSEFYKENPWAVPPKPKKWWQKVKDFFKKIGKAIIGGIKKAVDWVIDKVKKAVKATIAFIKKHWKAIVKIVVGVVIIAGLAALSVFTGGAASVALAAAAKAAATCALTSAATTVVKGVAEGKSAGEIFDSAADSFMVGAASGAIGGAAGAAGGAVLSATGSTVLSKLTEIGVKTAGEALIKGTQYLIDNGTLSGFWKSQGKGILMGAAGSALGATTEYLKNVGTDFLKDKLGALSNSELVKSFKSFYGSMQEKFPTLTNVLTKTAKDVGGSLSLSDLSKLKNPSAFAKELGNRALGSLASNAKAGAMDFINNDLNNITGGAVSKVTGAVSNIVGGVKGDLGSALGGMSGQFKSAANTLLGGTNNSLGSTVLNIGKSIAGNVSGGTGSLISNDIKSVSGAVGQIMNVNIPKNISGTFQNLAIGTAKTAFDKFCGSGFAGSVSSALGGASGTGQSVLKLSSASLSAISSAVGF